MMPSGPAIALMRPMTSLPKPGSAPAACCGADGRNDNAQQRRFVTVAQMRDPGRLSLRPAVVQLDKQIAGTAAGWTAPLPY
jgi:hypothetical protein